MSRLRLLRLLVPALVALASLGVPVTAVAAGFPGVEQPLSIRWTAGEPDLAVSGTTVVYDDDRNGNYDIYLFDLTTFRERRLTTDSSWQRLPAISGTNVVYRDDRSGSGDIYLYDLATDTERPLTTNAAAQSSPAISGTRVVYQDSRNGNSDIYLYDLATGTESRLTSDSSDQWSPAISGLNVVYMDNRNGNRDIYLYDLATSTEKRLTTDPADQGDLAVSGTRVVYADERYGNYDVFLYDLATGAEKELTIDLDEQRHPSVSGDRVVYQDRRSGPLRIYLYDLVAGREMPLTAGLDEPRSPVVSGELVLYSVPAVTPGQYGIVLGELATPRLSASAPSVVGYGGEATVKGALASFTGIPIAGSGVALEVSADGVLWAPAGDVITSPSGAFSLTSPALYRASYLRSVFRGHYPYYVPAHSAPWLVKPKASVGAPVAPGTMLRTSTYTIRGSLKPRHASGSAVGKLYCYRYESGTYRLKKTCAVTARDYSTYSRYETRVRLPASGAWKMRMRHGDADHAVTYSSWRLVTVR